MFLFAVIMFFLGLFGVYSFGSENDHGCLVPIIYIVACCIAGFNAEEAGVIVIGIIGIILGIISLITSISSDRSYSSGRYSSSGSSSGQFTVADDMIKSRKDGRPHTCYNCGRWRPYSYSNLSKGGVCRHDDHSTSSEDSCPKWN